MFELEEQELEKTKKLIEQTPIPEKIDQYIDSGINKGKKRRNALRKRNILISFAASFLLIFLVSIRISPVFASYVSQIPGLDKIVQLVNYDKGLQLAVENEFMQLIGLSDEHEDLKFTVDGIIIDESRMMLFYTIENKGDHQFINLDNFSFYDEKGEHLKASLTYEHFIEMDMRKHKTLTGKIDVNLPSVEEIPETITLEARLREELSEGKGDNSKSVRVGEEFDYKREMNVLASTWKIQFSIDKSKFQDLKEEYYLNETVMIEDQSITFNKVTVYPTRIAVEVTYDNNNSKKIFSIDDLRIVDEKGEEFAAITNGISRRYISDNTHVFYLQSNYFVKPKELYLKASRFKALEKDKLEVVINLEEGKITRRPDERIRLDNVGVNQKGDEIVLEFLLKREQPLDEKYFYDIFNFQYTDSFGNNYDAKGSSFGSFPVNEDGFDQQIFYNVENIDYLGPIILQIDQYPTKITGDISIKVK